MADGFDGFHGTPLRDRVTEELPQTDASAALHRWSDTCKLSPWTLAMDSPAASATSWMWDSQTQTLLLRHKSPNNGFMMIILSQKESEEPPSFHVLVNVCTLLSTDSINSSVFLLIRVIQVKGSPGWRRRYTKIHRSPCDSQIEFTETCCKCFAQLKMADGLSALAGVVFHRESGAHSNPNVYSLSCPSLASCRQSPWK